MTLSPELTALRDEAMRTTCESWAIQKRWTLSRGVERVGACPQCGGTDRFSINVREDLFNCRKCGIAGGGVIKLVMATEGLSFIAACELITGRKAAEPVDAARMDALRRQAEADARRRDADAEQFRRRAIEDGRAILRRTAPVPVGGVVGAYLAEVRGLGGGRIDFGADGWAAALHLRWIAEHPYWDERQKLHTGPAMIAAIQAPDDRFVGAHQTWLDLGQPAGKLLLPPGDKGKPRSAKKVRGSWKGGAIRLFTPAAPRRIVMGEGIETTLTAYAHGFEPDTAYWAGIALGNMAGKAARDADDRWVHDQPDLDDRDSFVPPDWCAELVFLCDTDEPGNRTVDKITRGLRRAEALRPGLAAFRVDPLGAGRDLNDLVRVEG